MRLTPHFTLAELTFSQTAARENIENRPNAEQIENLRLLCLNILEPVRVGIGKPITVTSGFRSARLNKAVGGAPSSQHLTGQAADIVCFAMPAKALFKRIIRMRLPYDQLIYEGTKNTAWVHVSYDAARRRGSILLATFPPAGGVHYAALTRAKALKV
jgi:hypothetical protein